MELREMNYNKNEYVETVMYWNLIFEVMLKCNF